MGLNRRAQERERAAAGSRSDKYANATGDLKQLNYRHCQPDQFGPSPLFVRVSFLDEVVRDELVLAH